MKSHHIAISVVGCALLFCSKDIWIEFIKEKSQTQREEMMRIERTELGKQETERLKFMSNVINHYPAMNQIKELSDQLVGSNDRINKLQDEVRLLKNQVRQPYF